MIFTGCREKAMLKNSINTRRWLLFRVLKIKRNKKVKRTTKKVCKKKKRRNQNQAQMMSIR